MPKHIRWPKNRPYNQKAEFRGWRWPDDTKEGREAISNWVTLIKHGRDLANSVDTPISVALKKTQGLKAMFMATFWIVNDDVKNIIESIDLNHHQYLPINVTNWDGDYIGTVGWYVLNV